MHLLLDTRTFLWMISDDPRLGPRSRDLIAKQADLVLLSLASLWQIACGTRGTNGMNSSSGNRASKSSNSPTGGLTVSAALHWAEASGVQLLPIQTAHLIALEQLPPHHQDPFDRMLLAQAIHTPLALMSANEALRPYGCLLVDPRL